MKAIGYARTASKEHAMRSIEKQKEQIAEYCNKRENLVAYILECKS
jgi:DNA invertase Pin-like site-specific DNA recombinase